jgi:hypothetical protein
MVMSICLSRRLAGVLATGLLSLLSCNLAYAQGAGLPGGMLNAGVQAENDFRVEEVSLARRGDVVRFHLTAVARYATTRYDARIEVDCVQRTRRTLSSVSDDGNGKLQDYPEETNSHGVLPGTRADTELRLVCNHPANAAAAWNADTWKPVAGGSTRPYRVASADDVVGAGSEHGTEYAILADTVHHVGNVTGFYVQSVTPDATWAGRQHVVVDCQRKLRAIQPDDAGSGSLTGRHVVANSREARELSLACGLPDGPRKSWFAGVVVSSDGVVVAPHSRTQGCTSISTGTGAQLRTLALIGNEQDIALLRIQGGGPWPVMPASNRSPALGGLPVTLLGVAGVEPRVSAALAELTGANEDDAGWPQVRTLSARSQQEGIVWDGSGSAIGLALSIGVPRDRQGQAFVRMLPASEVRLRLERHQLAWKASSGTGVDAESAMREAIAATIPLHCNH